MTQTNDDELIDKWMKEIVRRSRAEEHNGEWYCACPFCGKDSNRRNVHYSFSVRGYKCFVCGASGSVYGLAKHYGIIDGTAGAAPVYTPKPAKPKSPPSWLKHASKIADSYCNNNRYMEWEKYKAVTRENIDFYRLGFGCFPEFSSKCQHNRLMVPLITSAGVVGIRGRSHGCDCGKWLSAAGSQIILYNSNWLQPNNAGLGISRLDRVDPDFVLIVENPVDAIMIEQNHPNIRAVATFGVTIWNDNWSELLRGYRVMIVYDKDLAGNGYSTQREYELAWAEWRKKNPLQQRVPTPNGIKLANRLQRSGVNARLYQWEERYPSKSDIGMLIQQGVF